MKRIERDLLLLFLGFMGGMVYYNLLVSTGEEVKEEPQIVMQEKEEEIIELPAVEEEKCNYDETTCKIKEISKKYGVDWKLMVAISKHETGNYQSRAFKELNNAGGMMYWDGSKMSLIKYNSLDEGINAYIKNLKYNYIDIGLTTIEKIQKKYAPIGENDNGTNQYWVSGVTRYYNELEEK